MTKISFYELLGVSDKAAPEEIQTAFERACSALDAHPDPEERRNGLVFLQHARDNLLDCRRRALHDRDRRQHLTKPPVQAAKNGVGWMLAVVVAVVAGGLLGWRLDKPDAALVSPIAVAQSARQTPVMASAPLPKLEDNSILPESPVPIAQPRPVVPVQTSPPATTTAEPSPIRVIVRGNPLMDKIIRSTYAIVGTQSIGTGVMIERDRLLTNCHVLAPNVLKGKIYAISPLTRARFEITEAAFLVKDDACVAKAPGLDGQAIAMGDTRKLLVGIRFHNLGFANGSLTLSAGQYVGNIVRSQQTYMISTNYCAPGVSGGALVDDEGRLIGLTSGTSSDQRFCASLTRLPLFAGVGTAK